MNSLCDKAVHLEQVMPLMREVLSSGKNVTFGPRGTSMLPLLRQGQDSVVLSPLPKKLQKYDLPLYQRDNGQYVLHRIVKAGDTYTCIGDNQFAPETGLRQDQMIALVTAVVRNGRQIPVTAVQYRLYCRLWHYSRPFRRIWRRGKHFLRRLLK